MSVVEYLDKSVLLTIFEDIRTKIIDNVTSISEVVVYSNQEANEENQLPFEYPYVSLQIIINWFGNEAPGVSTANPAVNGSIGRQSKGEATIIVHTMFRNRNTDTASFLENEVIRHEVHRAIHLMNNNPHFTELIKVQDQLPVEIDASQDYMTSYICAVKEGALIDKAKGIIPEIEIDGGRVPPLSIT